ncbi:type 1 periplasmic binding fold superfamily protein [uncultured Winogradskyella sp.]|uniref:type 1 periplasmic binding fold superfamily protein n=1 Tax=uncultured Winogradskyella sp. TaxID=395353 RepID=UPI00261C1D48|nr:type 1 periplasmic binding fold superfamily protein [uncultured Winogradskyella sp.]
MKTIKYLFIAILSSTFFMACSDDDTPVLVNEEEVITTVQLTLIPVGSGDTVIFESKDLDADGPNAPVITTMGSINASSDYIGTVKFLNELEDPAEDITEEVADEADEHQVFYSFSGNSNSSVGYSDADEDGNPIGLSINFNSGTAATGNTVTITLRHEPTKDASGVSDGDITNAGGETDVEATFTYDVN